MEDRKIRCALVKKETSSKNENNNNKNEKRESAIKMDLSKDSEKCVKKQSKAERKENKKGSDLQKNEESRKDKSYNQLVKRINQRMEAYDEMLNQICKHVAENQTILKNISPFVVTSSSCIEELLKVQKSLNQKLFEQEAQSSQSLNETIAELEEDLELAQKTIDQLNEEKKQLMSEMAKSSQKIKQLTEEKTLLAEEISRLEQEIKTLEGNYHQQELMCENAEQKLKSAEHNSRISILKAIIKSTEEEYQIIETGLEAVNADDTQSVNYFIEDCRNFFRKYSSFLNENGFYEIGKPGGHDRYDPEIHFLIEGQADQGDCVYIQDIGWRIDNEIYKRACVLREDED